jgi:hypothetical protein
MAFNTYSTIAFPTELWVQDDYLRLFVSIAITKGGWSSGFLKNKVNRRENERQREGK